MIVKVHEKQAYIYGNKNIKLFINGEERDFYIKTRYNDYNGFFYYNIPDDFPQEIIKLIFGAGVRDA